MKIRTKLQQVAQRSAVAATLVAGLLVLPTSPAAQASGPRPFFQMPLACGQTWEASTYDGHWPDQDSIDLGQWTGNSNISKGQPVLASADGVVLQAFTHADGSNRVYLDHGAGWVTHYIHLQSLPPLTVGQHVAQGQVIGTVGNSGTEAFHLHYTQLQDGKAVRIAFNGSLINTGQTNTASWGTWGNGEVLTSLNCPQNSFASGFQAGQQTLLTYKPGTGKAAVQQVKVGGLGVTTKWSGTWTKGWTHFTPFVQSGKSHSIGYKYSTGEVDFDRLNAGGVGYSTIGEGTWSKGWTHFMPFSLGSTQYYVAYNSLYGGANVDRVNGAGNGAATLWSGSWGKGWTHLAPFRLNGVQYFVAYSGGSGAVEIDKITGSGNSVSITEVWSGSWLNHWSHLVPVVHSGGVNLIRYASTTGAVSFEKINAGGLGITHKGSATWSKSWTTFSPVTVGTAGHVLIYKTGTGDAKVMKFNAAGSAMSAVWSGAWSTGWA